MDIRRPIRALPLVALGASLALLIVVGNQNRELERRYTGLLDQMSTARPGYTVPTFEAVTLAGEGVVVGDSPEGRTQLLFVFSPECVYCRASVPAWQALADRVRREASATVQILGVSQDSILSRTREFAGLLGSGFDIVQFPEYKLIRLYRAGSVPLIVALDAAGRVRYSRLGVLAQDSVVAVDSVLAGVLAAAASQ